jgi:hypothetical protein
LPAASPPPPPPASGSATICVFPSVNVCDVVYLGIASKTAPPVSKELGKKPRKLHERHTTLPKKKKRWCRRQSHRRREQNVQQAERVARRVSCFWKHSLSGRVDSALPTSPECIPASLGFGLCTGSRMGKWYRPATTKRSFHHD